MNYDQTRQAAQMRVAEMGQVLRHCGLRLRDEYTLDDAIEFAGKRVLELIDDGYAGMLALLAAHSHAGRRVSDDILFVDATMPLTVQTLSKLMRDVCALAKCPLHADNMSIKYSAIYRPYKKRLIKSSNIAADIEFDMPDAPIKWHVPSAIDESISTIPNLTSAHVGDTVINSPSDEWRMTVSGVRLLSHISESAEAIESYEIDSIYIGGGTPSCYGAKRIVEILDELKRIGNVRLDSEITVEVNPDTTKLEELKLLRAEGVNRLSIGVQSANNDILKIIGRRHNFRQAEIAVDTAREAGFENVSLDLIYGLPSQTRGDWADTLSRALELHPEHLSCYGLKLEEGTPMYRSYLGSPLIPDEDEQADMYLYTVDTLAHYGLKQYEISNFAIPGYESRHNLKYWQLGDYMGFGPGAHSCAGGVRYSYVRDLDRYVSAVVGDSMIIDEYEQIGFI